jgi:hypothetical protein
MSLINDALKKAQRERSGSAPQSLPLAATAGATGAARPAAKPSTNLWPIAIAAVALVGGGAAVWFLKPAAPAAVTVAASMQPAAPVVNETSPQPVPVPAPTAPAIASAARPEAAPPQLHIDLPGNAASAPALQSAPAQQPSPPAVAVAVAPEVSAASAPGPFQINLQVEDPRILAYLDNARVSGIRVAADDAKLLMNSKVYRTGDTVDRELGLKLVTIRPTELIFEDKRGTRYLKLL